MGASPAEVSMSRVSPTRVPVLAIIFVATIDGARAFEDEACQESTSTLRGVNICFQFDDLSNGINAFDSTGASY